MEGLSELLDTAKAKGVRIATAESCTGGMVAAALTDLPGSSAIMDRGFVTYSNQAKCDLLGVSQTTLDAKGAVSEEIAAEMARGALARSDAHLTVSITGVAGPGGTDAKPEGMVCFGCATAKGCETETRQFGAIGRDRVRAAARDHALGLLLKKVRTMPAQ
jgi:nicotinamide-nucleotide amidase